MATFGGPWVSPQPNVLFDPMRVEQAATQTAVNQMLLLNQREDRRFAGVDRDRAHVAQTSAMIHALPAEQRPAAYAAAVADLQRQGIAMRAPPQYPGDAAIEALALGGLTPAQQFQRSDRQADRAALLGYLGGAAGAGAGNPLLGPLGGDPSPLLGPSAGAPATVRADNAEFAVRRQQILDDPGLSDEARTAALARLSEGRTAALGQSVNNPARPASGSVPGVPGRWDAGLPAPTGRVAAVAAPAPAPAAAPVAAVPGAPVVIAGGPMAGLTERDVSELRAMALRPGANLAETLQEAARRRAHNELLTRQAVSDARAQRGETRQGERDLVGDRRAEDAQRLAQEAARRAEEAARRQAERDRIADERAQRGETRQGERDLVGDRRAEDAQRLAQEAAQRAEEAARRQAERDRIADERAAEAARRQAEQDDRARRREGLPNGWIRDADGKPVIEENGPADPAVIARQAVARGEGRGTRPMPGAERNQLVDTGQKRDSLRGLKESFQADFGGFLFAGAGDLANTVARNTPGDSARASWWQQYDRTKNEVRNSLFGSALTPSEAAAFEKADINPGMSAATIRTNLTEQARLIDVALRRRARSMAADGYNTRAIEEASGIRVDEEAPGGAPPPPPPPPGGGGAGSERPPLASFGR